MIQEDAVTDSSEAASTDSPIEESTDLPETATDNSEASIPVDENPIKVEVLIEKYFEKFPTNPIIEDQSLWQRLNPNSFIEHKMNRHLRTKRSAETNKLEAEQSNEAAKPEEDPSARQYNRRPYPIHRPYNPNYGPSREDDFSDESLIYRTYDYCYTLWCKLKKMARNLI